MISTRIDKILLFNEVTKRYYKGTFPSDLIPEPKTFPASYIVNLDTSINEGSHWTAIFCLNPHEVWYFDSLGVSPTSYIKKYLTKFPKIRLNLKPIQNMFSNACGQYCIYFLYSCSLGINYEIILKKLYDCKEPDLFVRNFTKSLIK